MIILKLILYAITIIVILNMFNNDKDNISY